jgi:uncharacterized membrane protein YkoI
MLFLAATLSVFALVLVGGLATRLAAQAPAAPTPEAAIAAADPQAAQAGIDPTAVQALLNEREQSYQRLIREANERLEQTNAQLEQSYQKQRSLAAQLDQAYQQQAQPARPRVQAQPQAQAQPQPTATLAAPLAPTYAVSPDLAVTLALSAAPGATLTRQPELVDFQGTAAYEVMLDRGAVYVDANTGQVLYNSAANVASSGGHGGEHEDGEHEGGEHDD